jgi:Asp-tRNA(Asn)/Glu-tRNA(Gln) amidotransferase A subunit family amidase
VVGYKPSYGRISRAGVIPLAESFDTEALNAAHRRLLSVEMARHHARWFPRFADRYRPRTATPRWTDV